VLETKDDLANISNSNPRIREYKLCDPKAVFPDDLSQLLPSHQRESHWWKRIPTVPRLVPQGSQFVPLPSEPAPQGNVDITMTELGEEEKDELADDEATAPQAANVNERPKVSHLHFIFTFSNALQSASAVHPQKPPIRREGRSLQSALS
jgi:hypothetical protein